MFAERMICDAYDILLFLNFKFFHYLQDKKWRHFKCPLPRITQHPLYAFSKFFQRTTSIIISGSKMMGYRISHSYVECLFINAHSLSQLQIPVTETYYERRFCCEAPVMLVFMWGQTQKMWTHFIYIPNTNFTRPFQCDSYCFILFDPIPSTNPQPIFIP